MTELVHYILEVHCRAGPDLQTGHYDVTALISAERTPGLTLRNEMFARCDNPTIGRYRIWLVQQCVHVRHDIRLADTERATVIDRRSDYQPRVHEGRPTLYSAWQ
jgi:hypothetical protein